MALECNPGVLCIRNHPKNPTFMRVARVFQGRLSGLRRFTIFPFERYVQFTRMFGKNFDWLLGGLTSEQVADKASYKLSRFHGQLCIIPACSVPPHTLQAHVPIMY